MKKKSNRGRKSKIKIVKGNPMRPCPCPIHKGKFLPLNESFFHRAGKNGFQGYCKEFRNSKQNESNKLARQKKQPFKATCRSCKKIHPLIAQYWQKDAKRKSGFRPECKECIKKKLTKNS